MKIFFIIAVVVRDMPSLYVDFNKKLFYSMYVEPASYEDYTPVGWDAKYNSFLDIIPVEK